MDIVRNVRRQVASFSLATLIASFFAIGVAQAQTFPDVQPSDWFYSYVEDLVALGVVNGSMPEYRPADNVNRAEMAKLVVEAFDLPLEDPSEATFKDVAKSEWYYTYVETAAAHGVVGGYKDTEGTLTGYYGPGDDVTREQAAKMIVLGAPLTTNTNCGPTFPDVPMSAWSYEYVETLYVNSVIDGYPDGTFGPTSAINRAEIAKIVSNGMAPVLRPCGGFNVEDASAMSSTTVEVCYNAEYDETSGLMEENYGITYLDDNDDLMDLAVSDVAATSDPMCVELTTASQEPGKSYDVMVSDVTSADGADLGIADASFTGYSAVGTGGDLTCEAGTQPDGISVPQGATGVPFAVINCTASDDPVVLAALYLHRFGAGDEGDLQDVYLYEGDDRLTTGRSINSETQMAGLTGLNYTIDPNQTASFVVVGDIAVGAAAASQHGFELLNKDDVESNASSVGGTYPIEGNLMTISGAVAGTVSIESNGSLDELTIGETGRIAQFELEADGQEAMEFERIALYVRGTCDADDVMDLKLFKEGDSEVLAEATGVGSKDLATLSLDNPYLIGQGESGIFYVEAKNSCRNNETIRTFLDETTDLLVTGVTYGTGARVDSSRPLPGNYDGQVAGGGVPDGFSEVLVKGSDFNVAFNGPDAGDIAIGQDEVSCLDMTLTNAAGEALEIEDWEVTLDVINAPAVPVAGGLLDTTGTTTANYTLIKLVEVNEDGTYGGSLLGPSELSTAAGASDTSQVVVLDGTDILDADSIMDVAIVMDVASNTNIAGDQIRCTLDNLTTAGKDYVRDLNNDTLGAESITPSSDLTGNTFNLSAAGLTFELASTPATRTYTSGTDEATLVGFTVRSGSSLDNTIKTLTVQGYVDDNLAGAFSNTGASTTGDGTTNLRDVVDSLGLYVDDTLVSEIDSINATGGDVIFNNLDLYVPRSTTINLELRGNINNAAPYGAVDDRLKFGLLSGGPGGSSPGGITAIDSNGQNVDLTSIITNLAQNDTVANSGTIMTITSGGSGSTGDVESSTAQVVTSATKKELSRVKFTSTVEDVTMKDLQFGILNGNSAPISKIYLAQVEGGSCGTTLGSSSGYAANGTTGIFTLTDVNVVIPQSSSLTMCVLGDVNTVGTPAGTQPVSGSNVGVALLNVTEIIGGSGTNVSDRYVSDQTAAVSSFLDVDMTAGGGTAFITETAGGHTFVAGDVLVIDQEMMLVTGVTVEAGGDDLAVLRGFGNTTAVAHLSGDAGNTEDDGIGTKVVGKSTLAINDTTLATTEDIAGDTCLDATATAGLEVGDVLAIDGADGGVVEYALVTELADPPTGAGVGTCDDTGGTDDMTVVRQLFNSTLTVATAGDEVTRFPVHGDLFRLRRSRPIITQNTLAAPYNLPGGARQRLMSINVAAEGQDDVDFLGVAGNNIDFTLSGAAAGATAPPGACVLTDGVNPDYHNDAGAGYGVRSMTFAARDLTISAGADVDLYLECDTTGVDNSGNNVSVSLVNAATTVEWGDGHVANIVGDGSLIVTSTLSGPSFTTPF